jgi:hypothetical protein
MSFKMAFCAKDRLPFSWGLASPGPCHTTPLDQVTFVFQLHPHLCQSECYTM